MNKYILTDYQTKSVYNVVNGNDHGLLLWWSMGSGKTIAGITTILNYKGYGVIIICPKNIQFLWENEINNFKIKNNIKYYSFDNLDKLLLRKNLSNYIVIIDEAHNLISNVIKNKLSKKHTIELLNTCYKVLLLSGTPLYTDYTDLIYLINISAGKEILPYNNSKFKNMFFENLYMRSSVFGYYKPIINNITKIFTISAISKDIINLDIFRSVNVPVLLKNIAYKIYNVLNFFDLNNILDNLKNILGTANSKHMSVFLGIILVANIFLLMTNNLYKYKIDEYKYMNTLKLSKYIHPYVSVYKKSKNTTNFPSVNIKTIYVPYNNYQLSKWIELTQNNLSFDNIKDLEISTEDDIKFYTNSINIDEYVNKGVFIGNLNNNDEFSPKFYKILSKSKGKKAVFYSSSLGSGINQFKKFLNFHKIDYLYLDINITNIQKNKILELFKNSRTFLLLHSNYSEGISISGAEQMHILEPINNLSKKEQIIARIVRYDSHMHISPGKRHVDVFQWACESTTIISKILKLKISLQKWLKLNSEVLYTEDYLLYPQDMTPDYIILKKEKINVDLNTKIISDLEKNRKNDGMNCCIDFPSKEQHNECMKKHGKKC